MTAQPENVHAAYHAHVYFEADTAAAAERLCTEAGGRFGVKVGRFHHKLVGPHPCWSCQLAFNADEFDALIPWLDQHRRQLTILVHGVTGDDLADHTGHAAWLGAAVELNLSIFDK